MACNYSPLSKYAKYLYKRNLILSLLISCGLIFIMHSGLRSGSSRDIFSRADAYVMNKWFNQSSAERWYNNKNISMFDERLLEELRERWIIKTYNNETDHLYSGLQEPNIEEQSMGQAQAIKRILKYKKNGFFIECGAYDGETRSNTLYLERYLGWSGLLIEADPMNFSKMMNRSRRAYLSPTCLSIQPHPMNVSFLMANNIGRIHKPHNSDSSISRNTLDRAHQGIHVGVQCFPLASYIMALGVKTVDYFSLDVEGNEMEILKTIPFDILDIKTLSVEFSHVDEGRQKMVDYMEEQGYDVHSFVTHPQNLANDVIFVKRGMR